MAQSTSLYDQAQHTPRRTLAQRRPDTRMTSIYSKNVNHPEQRHVVKDRQKGRQVMKPYTQPKPLVSVQHSGIPMVSTASEAIQEGPISASLREYSRLVVVSPPERRFAVHDLITIVISERTSDSSDTKVETEKEMDVSASIDEFPNLDVRNLIRGLVGGSTLTNPPKVKTSMSNEFTGEGKHENSHTITAQLTAEVIDIKPNGNLVLEARKNIRVDKETLGIILTGLCRPQDISVDNTIQSNKVANLRLIKAHDGDLRNVKKRGPLTKFFDWIVPF